MKKTSKFPEVPQALVDHLAQLLPDQCPRSDLGAFGLGVLAGQQQVLDLLKLNLKKQEETRHVCS